jgi:hypothetical protein
MATLQLSRLSVRRSNVKVHFKVKREIYGTAMKIGELAKATGLAPSRIRYYEARFYPWGLNGYRRCSRETRQTLEILFTAQ